MYDSKRSRAFLNYVTGGGANCPPKAHIFPPMWQLFAHNEGPFGVKILAK